MSKINNKLKIIINSTYLLNNRLLNNSKNLFKRLQAFTLLELIVVIAIISILAVIALPSFNKAIIESKSKSTIANMKLLIKQIQNDIANTGGVVQSVGDIPHSGRVCSVDLSYGSEFMYQRFWNKDLNYELGPWYSGCTDPLNVYGDLFSYYPQSHSSSGYTYYPHTNTLAPGAYYFSKEAMTIFKNILESKNYNIKGVDYKFLYQHVTYDNTEYLIMIKLLDGTTVCMDTQGSYKVYKSESHY
ncbi:MAG: type II secretion system protein [Cyanobium sp. MAG06]|nr:type II secretion system protein [Cyanobium sp. MAG06]